MKTRTAAFDTAWGNRRVRKASYYVTVKRRYYSAGAGTYVLEADPLTIPKREIDKISGLSSKFDLPLQNKILPATVTLTLLDKKYKWLPSNTASGKWRPSAAAPLGYVPEGSEFVIYYGYLLADETMEYLPMFTGVVQDDITFDSTTGTVTIPLLERAAAKLENGRAQNVCVSNTAAATSPTNGNGVLLTFSAVLKSVWEITTVAWNAITRTQGTDYTLDNLNDAEVAPSIVFEAASVPGAFPITFSYKQWHRNKSIKELAGLLCDEAGIGAGQREIDDAYFPGGAAGSKVIDTQAEWENGTALDTTTAPGSIRLPAATSFAYTGAEVPYVVPAGVTSIYIDLKGPGGGGGGYFGSSGGDGSTGGGGGGGGGVAAGSAGGPGSGPIPGAGGSGGTQASYSYIKRGGTTLAQALLAAGGSGGQGTVSGASGAGAAGGVNVDAGLTLTVGGGGSGGAAGNGGIGGVGGAGTAGDRITGNLAVTPGETLTIRIGAGGGGGGAGQDGETGLYTSPSGSAGANGSLSIAAATAVYESEVFNLLAAPVAWGSLDRTETLNGGTIAYATATSTDGISWDAYVGISGSGVIQSALKQYLKIRATITRASLGAASPQIDKLTARFITSSLFILSADFTGMTCAAAMQELAKMGGMYFGSKGDGTFYLRNRTVSGAADIVLSQKNAISAVTKYASGGKEVRPIAVVRYGESGRNGYYNAEYGAAQAGEAAPTTAQRFGNRTIELDLNRFIFANNADVALAIARKLYTLHYRPKRRITTRGRIVPHLDPLDKTSFSFHDSPLIENAIFGDPFQRFPVAGPNTRTLARAIAMVAVGHAPDLMKSESIIDWEEILE